MELPDIMDERKHEIDDFYYFEKHMQNSLDQLLQVAFLEKLGGRKKSELPFANLIKALKEEQRAKLRGESSENDESDEDDKDDESDSANSDSDDNNEDDEKENISTGVSVEEEEE